MVTIKLYIPYFYRQRSWVFSWVAQYHMIGTAEIWTRVWGQTLYSLWSLKNLNISWTDSWKCIVDFTVLRDHELISVYNLTL